MYLVSQIYRHHSKWGRYLCNVFYSKNTKNPPIDITQEICGIFDLKYKNWHIDISAIGYWDWITKITGLLRKENKNCGVYNVSVRV